MTLDIFQMYYVSLNGVVIPNHGYVIISDIGNAGDDTALLCHTNHPADMINGNWYYAF